MTSPSGEGVSPRLYSLGESYHQNYIRSGSDLLKLKDLLLISLLTFAALLIHGYHAGAEDAEIYLPGIEKILHPELFPFNSQFFEAHAHSTLFPNLIAASVRISHLRLGTALFLWQIASIFLLLLACWQLSARCFSDTKARWCGVALVAALLTLPIAGTALYIMDQYLNPRNLSAFVGIFAMVRVLDRKYLQATLFLVIAGVIHPLMSVFALSFCILLGGVREFSLPWFVLYLPFGIPFAAPPSSYHQVALTHSYFYLTQWRWYEWLGVIGPMVILFWFARLAKARQWPNVTLLSSTALIYELVYVVLAVMIDVPSRFEALARLQPMRSLHLLYVLMLVLSGGVLAEFVFKNHLWRWLALFVPVCTGMFFAQRVLFPASAHIEWPWAQPKNQWMEAFRWIRKNTPENSIFALDPEYMNLPSEDEQGFRAVARRSSLADSIKDSGAVSMFPAMADEWWRQVQAQSGWSKFQLQDFHRLQAQYGVDWVVLQQPGLPGLDCPYQNRVVLVCRLD